MVTWYDTVVWLNALTEWVNAKSGSTLTPVYYYESGCTTVAKDSTYTSNFKKEDDSHSYASAYAKAGATGFRLPKSNEWELAARWRGSDATNTVSGYTDPYFTQGDFASGATADHNNATATGAVAWYDGNSSSKTQAVKGKAGNGLGLYDMSGNVWEWCDDWYPSYIGSYRRGWGGSWYDLAYVLQVGNGFNYGPGNWYDRGGFRPARTAQ
jgi:formylglycine-generating enzyme required for sulfatase activity